MIFQAFNGSGTTSAQAGMKVFHIFANDHDVYVFSEI
jgi:hypothetical protein